MRSRVVVVAVITKGNSILLGKKPAGVGPYPNTWVLPGGGVDLDNETLEEAILREITEETRVTVGELEPLFFDEDWEPDKEGEQTHYVYITYRTEYRAGVVKAGDDVVTLKWNKVSELSKLSLPRPSIKLFKRLGWL